MRKRFFEAAFCFWFRIAKRLPAGSAGRGIVGEQCHQTIGQSKILNQQRLDQNEQQQHPTIAEVNIRLSRWVRWVVFPQRQYYQQHTSNIAVNLVNLGKVANGRTEYLLAESQINLDVLVLARLSIILFPQLNRPCWATE